MNERIDDTEQEPYEDTPNDIETDNQSANDVADSVQTVSAQPSVRQNNQLKITRSSPVELRAVVPTDTSEADLQIPSTSAVSVDRVPRSSIVPVNSPDAGQDSTEAVTEIPIQQSNSLDIERADSIQRVKAVDLPTQSERSIQVETADSEVSLNRRTPKKVVSVELPNDSENRTRSKLNDEQTVPEDEYTTHETGGAGDSILEGELEDLEEFLFEWSGGTPYTSRQPQIIVHEQQADGESLALLQRLLRDNYTFLRGGEPTAMVASTKAGELQTADLSGKIVTLDLAAPKFSGGIRDDVPRIELQQSDIVPTLAEWADTLYAGGLGYLIVSVPMIWNDPERGVRFAEQLRTHLSDSIADAPDVRTARPRGQREWAELASQYFGVPSGESNTVSEAESTYQQLLELEDWRATALGKQSGDPNGNTESDEHYLLKSKLAETIVHRWYLESSSVADTEYAQFLTNEAFEENLVETEYRENKGSEAPRPDVWVSAKKSALMAALGRSCSFDEAAEPPFDLDETVVVEYETGRGQGRFSFRKLRDTLDKYNHSDLPVDHILLAVPPALLLTGQNRAVMINRLVTSWNQTTDGTTAYLSIPQLSNRETPGGRDAYGVDITLRVLDNGLSGFYGDSTDD